MPSFGKHLWFVLNMQNPQYGPLSVMWCGVSLVCVTVLSALTETAGTPQIITVWFNTDSRNKPAREVHSSVFRSLNDGGDDPKLIVYITFLIRFVLYQARFLTLFIDTDISCIFILLLHSLHIQFSLLRPTHCCRISMSVRVCAV